MESRTIVILGRVAPENKVEFNNWYDQVHIPDVLESPGFISGKRSDISWKSGAADYPDWTYATIFEVISESPDLAIKDMMTRTRSSIDQANGLVDKNSLLMICLSPDR